MRNRNRLCSIALLMLAIVLAATRQLHAGPPVGAAPEIDPGAIVAGVGLLSAGVLMLRARRRK